MLSFTASAMAAMISPLTTLSQPAGTETFMSSTSMPRVFDLAAFFCALFTMTLAKSWISRKRTISAESTVTTETIVT